LLASRGLAGLISLVSSLASPAKFEARRYNDFSTNEGALSRPFTPRNSSPASFIRINGKIRAREVRVIGFDGSQLGVMLLNDAINLARQAAVDLVEIAPNAVPPVCRVVDFGKYRYELAKKEKESKKHQHASTVKEIQLSPRIDPHDLSVKVGHAIDFLCEDMKVKVTLRFRGREMQHTEFGFEVVKKFIAVLEPYGHPDFPPKMIGRGINMMMSPLPRNKRAKNPRTVEESRGTSKVSNETPEKDEAGNQAPPKPVKPRKVLPPTAESEVSESVPPANT
jgi:translation initiation factor IF-3